MSEESKASRDLAACLISDSEELLEKWEVQVRAGLASSTTPDNQATLRNNLPQLLGFISKAVRAGSIAEVKEELVAVAHVHARERVSLPNYSLDNVLYEYGLFRETIFSHFRSEYMSMQSALLVNQCIDLSMRTSASQFVHQSQHRERRQEAERERLLHEVDTEHRRLEVILDQMPVGVSIAERPGGKLLYHNRAAVQLLGHPLLESESYEDYFQYGALHPDGTPYRVEEYPISRSVLHGETVTDEEMSYRRGDGTTTCLSVSSVPVDIEGSVPLAVSVFSDISVLKDIQGRLAQKKELAEITLRAMGDGLIRVNYRGEIEQMNPAAEKLCGWDEPEVKGRQVNEVLQLKDERDGMPAELPITRSLAQNRIMEQTTFLALRHREGQLKPVNTLVAPIHDRDGQVVGGVVILHDATEERRRFESLARDALHDSLTGLVNRREFERRLQRTVDSVGNSHKPATLLYLDLDNFKIINDECGHAAGDQLLIQLTALIQEQIRDRDTFARLGGDEFGIILEHCATDLALSIANNIRETVEAFVFPCSGSGYSVGVSIGLVNINEAPPNLKHILELADQACYAAKEAGRNRVCVAEMDRTATAFSQPDLDWARLVEDAISNDQLLLFGQRIKPLSRMAGKAYGLEVFVRLQDDKGDIYRPSAFFPAAERYDFMPALDYWVVENVLKLLAKQADRLESLTFCTINLSPQTLVNTEAVDRLMKLLAQNEVAPDKLCFEIPEVAVMRSYQQVLRFTHALKNAGYRIALQDVGTSLVSFRHIKRLPIDYFKIGGLPIEKMSGHPEDFAIVRSLNDISHVLGKQTIAKFVNAPETLTKLEEIGVDYAQGYYVSQPAALEEALAVVH